MHGSKIKTKLTIGHLIQSLGVGGCEKSLLLTLPNMTKYRHHIFVLKEKGDLSSEFEKQGIEVTVLTSPLQLLGHSKNIDLLFTYMFHADFFGRFMQFFLSVPVVPYLRTTYNHPNYLIARVFERLTSFLVSKYLANSQAVKDFYASNLWIDPKKIKVIPNGIEIRKQNKLLHKGINILCVANFHPNKGHEFLIKAFGLLKKSNVRLILVGEGQTLQVMKSLASHQANSQNIIFLGKRFDVEKIMEKSDIFVLPTLFEGLSRALMSAMGAGLAVVTTDIPENRVLVESGKDGLLVPVKDASSIRDALIKLIDSPSYRKKLAEQGRKKILTEFELLTTCKHLSAFIDSMIVS